MAMGSFMYLKQREDALISGDSTRIKQENDCKQLNDTFFYMASLIHSLFFSQLRSTSLTSFKPVATSG